MVKFSNIVRILVDIRKLAESYWIEILHKCINVRIVARYFQESITSSVMFLLAMLVQNPNWYVCIAKNQDLRENGI